MNIIAFDPGSITTGWAVVQAAPLSYGSSGSIHLGQGPWIERIVKLTQAVRDILSVWSVDELVLEKAFVGLNKESSLKIAQIRGALMALCARPGISLTEYAPREVKAQITGYGAATKEQIAHMVGRFYPTASAMATWDESDALALATCHALRSGKGHILKRTRC